LGCHGVEILKGQGIKNTHTKKAHLYPVSRNKSELGKLVNSGRAETAIAACGTLLGNKTCRADKFKNQTVPPFIKNQSGELDGFKSNKIALCTKTPDHRATSADTIVCTLKPLLFITYSGYSTGLSGHIHDAVWVNGAVP
jgi:hypothetical protein